MVRRSNIVRRSKLKISLTMLEIIHGGESKPTRIMRICQISYDLAQKILKSLLKQQLIDETVGFAGTRTRKAYRLTRKGEDVLEYFVDIVGLLGDGVV